MKIYIVAYEDYDGSDSVGYFLEESKAEECRKYLDRARPSCYSESGYTWDVYKYELDEIDYASLNKEFDEKERIKYEAELEKERQEELAELARLKAKYEIYFKG